MTVVVSMGVIRAAQEAGVDREQSIKDLGDEELEKWVRSKMYDPLTESKRIEEEVESLVDSISQGGNRRSHL